MNMSRSRRRFLIRMAAAGAAAGVMVPLSRYGLASMALQGKQEGAKLKVVFYTTPDGLGINEFAAGGEWNGGKGIWHPTAMGNDTGDFQLNTASQELAAYKNRALFLRGLASVSAGTAPVSPFLGHAAWQAILRDRAQSQTSIDNILARHLTGHNPTLGAIYAGPHTKVGSGGQPSYVSFDGRTARVPQKHPVVLFDSIFGTDLRGLDVVRSAHVFDPVKQDIDDAMGKVQGSERQKLVTHLDAVEQVAKELEEIVEPGQCLRERPELGGVDVDGSNDRNVVHAAHHKVVAAALACGTVRVATIQVAYTLESLMINEVSTRKNPHDLAHWGLFDGPASPTDRQDWENSRKWYVRKVKEFLDELSSHQDPDLPEDSLLDHTLVVFTSEMADGAPEHCMDMPLVMIGAGGLLNYGSAGRYFDIGDQGEVFWDPSNPRPAKQVSMQRVWATLARAAGAGEVPYSQNIETVNGIFKNLS